MGTESMFTFVFVECLTLDLTVCCPAQQLLYRYRESGILTGTFAVRLQVAISEQKILTS